MHITGEMLIGAQAVRGKGAPVDAIDPASGGRIDADGGPRFTGGDLGDVERACALAHAAFTPFRNASDEARARLLETIAQGLLDCGDALIARVQRESALPVARLLGERQRTVNQLRLFADLLRDSAWRCVVIDRALPERTPPRSDLRQQLVALGPVAVFGASNFPLAFSVAGGDTASALAAGCPVIVKAHNAHLGTSEIVGRVIQRAVAQCGLPEGVFSLLIDADTRVGAALVAHPAIQAVGFTGSRAGGHALHAIAQGRPQPIPVYAEMSAINPVFLLPDALAWRGEALAAAYVDSLTLGVGQFCTNPGLVVGIDGPAFARFAAEAARRVGERPAATLLTPGIARAYTAGVQGIGAQPGVVTLASGLAATAPNQASASLWRVAAEDFMRNARLSDEVFGPASLLVACRDEDELMRVAQHLEGQLTATLHVERDDAALAQRLLPVLETKAGRVLANGWPTGVEVCAAMVHGGPYPSTFDARSTSVGSRAIERFVRPVCYQDLPDWLLPPALRIG